MSIETNLFKSCIQQEHKQLQSANETINPIQVVILEKEVKND